jgi:hypothetical protein
MKIKCVQYEQFNNAVLVEVYFVEDNSSFTHSRSFEFKNEDEKDLVYSDILSMLKEIELFKQFS